MYLFYRISRCLKTCRPAHEDLCLITHTIVYKVIMPELPYKTKNPAKKVTMRSHIFQLPMLLAAAAQAHVISMYIPQSIRNVGFVAAKANL